MTDLRMDIPPELEAAYLEEMRAYFNGGDRHELFRAIRFCGEQGIPMPDWVVEAFAKAMNKWYSMRAKTLDEAFSVKFPKGKHLAAAKKQRKLKFAVYHEVMKAKRQQRAVDEKLYEEIGKKLGLGKTRVGDYYRAARYVVERPTVMDKLLEDLVVPGFVPPQYRKK